MFKPLLTETVTYCFFMLRAIAKNEPLLATIVSTLFSVLFFRFHSKHFALQPHLKNKTSSCQLHDLLPPFAERESH